ncbi:Mitochondrial inner membrane protease subunit 2 [Fukomys damarensis]|uniref:Mitochondrial inner membrane protease subunit 2 n=1 Tax=Fukomys damarensis TaxID=885580 RepID=A0A091CZ82_FUKDA|nr:Mitochondrial inner membrane protease subunit 2 [Fukomys damarensis]
MGFGQIGRGHKITTYPFSPRKSGRKGMAQSQGWMKKYFKAFCKGFFVTVPVAVTFLDRVACVARVEGASMQEKRHCVCGVEVAVVGKCDCG